jgi:RNA polymerase sigma factor (sigma-70 family)
MTATRNDHAVFADSRTDSRSTHVAARRKTPITCARESTIVDPSTRDEVSATTIDPARLAELLISARRGCKRSMHDIVQACEPHVRKQALRHSWRRDHVDDIVQEVWLQLLLNADRIRDPLSLLAWLNAVTRHTALHAGVRANRTVADDFDDTPSAETSTEEEIVERCSRRQAGPVVRRALERLDEPDRRLLKLLHRADRPSYQEIGRQVGRPVGSLGPTRQRLLRRLRADHEIAQLASLVTAA